MVVVSQDSHVFPIVKGKKKQPETYRQFQSVLKHMNTLLGKHSDDFSTHSFRRGSVTWAFSAEVPTELIQLYGDWKSDSDKKYVKINLKDNMFVANKMKTHILKKLN